MYLLDLQAGGVIRNLEREIRYPLHVSGIKVGTYIADHQFYWVATGVFQCEDVKSRATITPLYRRNKKHMMIEHGITVIEVFKPNE